MIYVTEKRKMTGRLNTGLLWLGLAVLSAVIVFSPERETQIESLSKRIQVLESRSDGADFRHARTREGSFSSDKVLSRLTALEKQLADWSARTERVHTAPGEDLEPRNTVAERGIADQALFEAQLAQAGVDGPGTTREDLRRETVDIWQTGAQLREKFDLLPLAGQARVMDLICYHSGCDISIEFDDSRAAIEKETQLMAWLASADGACGFELEPADITGGQGSATRHAELRCD